MVKTRLLARGVLALLEVRGMLSQITLLKDYHASLTLLQTMQDKGWIKHIDDGDGGYGRWFITIEGIDRLKSLRKK